MTLGQSAIILEIFMQLKEACGSQIIERFNNLGQGEIRMHQGTLYPIIQKLAADGLLEFSRTEETDVKGRPREYYRISAEGSKQAEKNRRTIARIFNPIA